MLLLIIKILGLICSIVCAVYNFNSNDKKDGFWSLCYTFLWLYTIVFEIGWKKHFMGENGMKIEEYKEVIYKSKSFYGSVYILEDKDILLNSINVLVKDSSPIKNICDFYINKISENQYKIFIPDYTIICNDFFVNYSFLRDVKKITLEKDECPNVTKKEDGSMEITFQKM